ncbi:MAG: hypothetical protein HQL40_18085 [Alphaproteobacteria bacterium]|nr:hypothetical protein [Alphaproteobacteria bacterium]MBF0335526.1 hypothetical protein [Alphaproteobacteria bacterium]
MVATIDTLTWTIEPPADRQMTEAEGAEIAAWIAAKRAAASAAAERRLPEELSGVIDRLAAAVAAGRVKVAKDQAAAICAAWKRLSHSLGSQHLDGKGVPACATAPTPSTYTASLSKPGADALGLQLSERVRSRAASPHEHGHRDPHATGRDR